MLGCRYTTKVFLIRFTLQVQDYDYHWESEKLKESTFEKLVSHF